MLHWVQESYKLSRKSTLTWTPALTSFYDFKKILPSIIEGVTIALILFSVMAFLVSGSALKYWEADWLPSTQNAVLNSSNAPIPLYPEVAGKNSVEAYFPAQEVLLLIYSGASGSWHYVDFHGRTLNVRSDFATLGVLLVGNSFMSLAELNNIFKRAIWLGVGSLFLFSFLMSRKKLINPKNNKSNSDAAHFEKLYRQEVESSEELKKNMERREVSYKSQINSLTNKQKADVERARQSMEKAIKQESVERHQATIKDMEDSYSRLDKQYKAFKNEVKDFGVDQDDPKYASLLKGRRYEIYVATSLVKNHKFEILEWTPDKGFESDIKVSANTNPDLIVADKAGGKLAVECKYRSDYFFLTKKDKKEVSWANKNQMLRYEKYSIDHNIKVYIALGLFGDPRNPKQHFLISLKSLCDSSTPVKVGKKGEQMIVRNKDIYHDFVTDGDYSTHLLDQKI